MVQTFLLSIRYENFNRWMYEVAKTNEFHAMCSISYKVYSSLSFESFFLLLNAVWHNDFYCSSYINMYFMWRVFVYILYTMWVSVHMWPSLWKEVLTCNLWKMSCQYYNSTLPWFYFYVSFIWKVLCFAELQVVSGSFYRQ